MDSRLDELEALNKTLKSPQELSGKFLPEDVPKQYDFIFIAEMPSMSTPKDISGLGGNFNVSTPDRFLQRMMTTYGVSGSYVTDIVKRGDIPRRPTKEEIQQWLPFLLKEIEIIHPKFVVVLGKRTYDVSFKPFIEPLISKDTKIDYVFHYSQQGAKTNAEVERRFSEVINKLRNNK